jgi:hypothetical protein
MDSDDFSNLCGLRSPVPLRLAGVERLALWVEAFFLKERTTINIAVLRTFGSCELDWIAGSLRWGVMGRGYRPGTLKGWTTCAGSVLTGG